MNRGIFIGRLGHTPELRDAGGTPVCNVNICVKVWSKDGDQPMWVPCVFWGHAAKTLAEYRAKGDEIAVDGEFEPHAWTGKDGTERKELRLIIRHGLTLTSGRSQANSEAGGGRDASEQAAEAVTETVAEPDDMSVPF